MVRNHKLWSGNCGPEMVNLRAERTEDWGLVVTFVIGPGRYRIAAGRGRS
jgi:hypothetical protein